ncbi:MAG: hypothetical protein KF724_10280 [Phycisphaeraceae bacterium]|nr:hypothetical protein [Phycisphaeraceae bacterium]
MSDRLTHECGLALVRLRHPISWYARELGDPLWGLRRLFLLMEKQHNRGQDGAGVACVKLDMPPGDSFMERSRTAKRNAIERLFDEAMRPFDRLGRAGLAHLDETDLKQHFPMLGETMLGHLRYGTHSGNSTETCHPYIRRHSVASRNVAVAGNFNLTNAREIFRQLVDYGLAPVGETDTGVVLEKVGWSIDREHEKLRLHMGPGSIMNLEGRVLAEAIGRELDLTEVLRRATETFDGAWVLAGLLGHGDAFVCRDPAGIRPVYWVQTETAVAVASERAAISTVFDLDPSAIEPIPPAHALIMKADGRIECRAYTEATPQRSCTFERIYFSRGNDRDIYRERKALGRNLADGVLRAIDHRLDQAVLGFIPNTSETAYLGLVQELEQRWRSECISKITQLQASGEATPDALARLLRGGPRFEKVAHKDQRLRTFITHDEARRDLVSHVYDITRGTVGPDDALVVVDDSIVRGTTLRESIITMLARLNPAKIVVASSAPPIKYPDCYGIDMARLGNFIAFEAAIEVIRERGEEALLEEVEDRCTAQVELPPDRLQNWVRLIYDHVGDEALSAKVAQLVRSPTLEWRGEIAVVYQSVEGLRSAMPEHTGDWYFTGEYPTPGGLRILNTAYLRWRRADERRAYEPEPTA